MLNENIKALRKSRGLSQQELAVKLNVVRQTVSKWETDETIPDLCQAKKMAVLYNISLDELIDFDIDLKEIQDIIDHTKPEVEERIDWTSAWGKRYPVLLQYQNQVNIPNFAYRIENMLNELKREYGFNRQDTVLVLKDILYHVWKNWKSS